MVPSHSTPPLSGRQGLQNGAGKLRWPVYSRGMFEGVLIARQGLLCCVSQAEENEVSTYILQTKTVFISNVSASLDVVRSAGIKAHGL